MVLTIKHCFSIYKCLDYDIWGLFFSRMSLKNCLSKFFYKIYLKKEEFRLIINNFSFLVFLFDSLTSFMLLIVCCIYFFVYLFFIY